MSHSYNMGLFTFVCNSDLSGEVRIYNQKTKERMEVDGRSILDFVAEHIRREKISRLEQMSTEEILHG